MVLMALNGTPILLLFPAVVAELATVFCVYKPLTVATVLELDALATVGGLDAAEVPLLTSAELI